MTSVLAAWMALLQGCEKRIDYKAEFIATELVVVAERVDDGRYRVLQILKEPHVEVRTVVPGKIIDIPPGAPNWAPSAPVRLVLFRKGLHGERTEHIIQDRKITAYGYLDIQDYLGEISRLSVIDKSP